MLPSAFVPLASLPLTVNGKLDRNALPAPDADNLARQAFQAPQGELEAELASIWQDLLALPQVGRDDNFFALGGHSLLAVQLLARIEQRLGMALALRELFAAPTLAELARSLQAGQAVQEAGAVALLPGHDLAAPQVSGLLRHKPLLPPLVVCVPRWYRC